MRTIRLASSERLDAERLSRFDSLPEDAIEDARAIVASVREHGDAALSRWSLKLDGVEIDRFRLPSQRIERAVAEVGAPFMKALEHAAAQIRDFHRREAAQSWFTTRADGTMLGMRVTPVASAGIYVPGGRARYPSTVLMNAIPARVAGVERIAMVTPPQRDGLVSAATLAAARIADVDEIYTVGGAQAIAALAYGTASIAAVDKITGPGNAFVAAAKRLVSGDVGIDMVAGPSEVCVLADATANPVVVAADLMAQAEHDPLAACYLVTADAALAGEVERALDVLIARSPRAEITRSALDEHGTIVLVADHDAAVAAVNVIAPEHLELHCDDALGIVGAVRSAGAIFIGAWSSEPLGDYVAGPNHTLPTGGTARFSSPLSVEDFVKRTSIVCYTPGGLVADAAAAQMLACGEGLWAHALSVGLRRRMIEGGETAIGLDALAGQNLTEIAWPDALRKGA